MKKIKVTLDRIEGNEGILVSSDQKEINIPKELLPDSKKGAIISLEIKTEEEAKLSDEKLAKAILNEILKK